MAKSPPEPERTDLLEPPEFTEVSAPNGLMFKNGFYVLPSRGGIVTNELIAEIEEQLALEDAGLDANGKPMASRG